VSLGGKGLKLLKSVGQQDTHVVADTPSYKAAQSSCLKNLLVINKCCTY